MPKIQKILKKLHQTQADHFKSDQSNQTCQKEENLLTSYPAKCPQVFS
jgi:hypothetical protein